MTIVRPSKLPSSPQFNHLQLLLNSPWNPLLQVNIIEDPVASDRSIASRRDTPIRPDLTDLSIFATGGMINRSIKGAGRAERAINVQQAGVPEGLVREGARERQISPLHGT